MIKEVSLYWVEFAELGTSKKDSYCGGIDKIALFTTFLDKSIH